MRIGLTRLAVSLACLLAGHEAAAAQVSFLEGLFKDITHVGGTHGCWNVSGTSVTAGDCDPSKGFGIRVTRTLGVLWLTRGMPERGDPTSVVVTTDSARGVNQLAETYAPRKPLLQRWRFAEVALELGYSQFSGIELSPAGAPLTTLRGELRELPAFSGYVRPHAAHWFESTNPLAREFNPLAVFASLGAHTGLVSASSVRATMPADTTVSGKLARDANGAAIPQSDVFSATGQTFQWGGSLGVGVRIGKISLSWETLYMSRHLNLSWKGESGIATVPDVLPQQVDGGGWTDLWTFRWQIADPLRP